MLTLPQITFRLDLTADKSEIIMLHNSRIYIETKTPKDALNILEKLITSSSSPRIIGSAYLYVGYIYAFADKLSNAIKYWKKAVKTLPLPHLYDDLKKFLINNPKHRETIILIQYILNLLADDGYMDGSTDIVVNGIQGYGIVEDWDNYLLFRLWFKYQDKMAKATASTKYLIPIGTQSIIEQDYTDLLAHALNQKHLGNIEASMLTYLSAVSMRPDDNAVHYNLGKICYLRNSFIDGVAAFLRTLHLEARLAAISGNMLFHPLIRQEITQNSLQARINLLQADPNTSLHLGHVLYDLNPNIIKPIQTQQYIDYYRDNLLGGKPTPWVGEVNELSLIENYQKIGIQFALERIQWDKLDTLEVIPLYQTNN